MRHSLSQTPGLESIFYRFGAADHSQTPPGAILSRVLVPLPIPGKNTLKYKKTISPTLLQSPTLPSISIFGRHGFVGLLGVPSRPQSGGPQFLASFSISFMCLHQTFETFHAHVYHCLPPLCSHTKPINLQGATPLT